MVCSMGTAKVRRDSDGLASRTWVCSWPVAPGPLGSAVVRELLDSGYDCTVTWIVEEERERAEAEFGERASLVRADLIDPEEGPTMPWPRWRISRRWWTSWAGSSRVRSRTRRRGRTTTAC